LSLNLNYIAIGQVLLILPGFPAYSQVFSGTRLRSVPRRGLNTSLWQLRLLSGGTIEQL